MAIETPPHAPPEFPGVPATNGQSEGSLGAGSAVSYVRKGDDGGEFTISLGGAGQGIRLPSAVSFWKQTGGEGDWINVTAATLGATWKVHEPFEGVFELHVVCTNTTVAPLKAGEVLRAVVTG